MNVASSDQLRSRLMRAGLVLGPLLALVSAIVGLGPEPETMRASFDAMSTRAGHILSQDLLETAGFTILLASLAAAGGVLHRRGSLLGLLGTIATLAGIVGFAVSNTTGLALVALAQLPDHDAAFKIASDISQDGPLMTAGMLGWILEILAQVGILLIIVGLWRGGVIRAWPIAASVVGMVINAAIGTIQATAVADAILLAVMTWVAFRLTPIERLPRSL